jgi:hypothetical protein
MERRAALDQRAVSVRILRIAAVIAAAALIAACERVVAPPLPADAVQFTPPAVYTTWWQMTEACSGLSGPLSGVTWYQTNDIVYDTHSGDVIAAYWVPGSNRIVVMTTLMNDGGVIRHEMLHALRQKGGHPRDQFLGKCEGVVDCEGPCVADAGAYPTPPETPLNVSGDGIAITLDVEPHTPARNIDDGRFTVTVMAHNLSMHWVQITPAAGVDPGQTFVVDVHGDNGATGSDEQAVDPSQTIFAPGETKRQVFDLVIGDYPFANQLLPGDYITRGGFAGWWSGDNSFTIAP